MICLTSGERFEMPSSFKVAFLIAQVMAQAQVSLSSNALTLDERDLAGGPPVQVACGDHMDARMSPLHIDMGIQDFQALGKRRIGHIGNMRSLGAYIGNGISFQI